MEKVETYKQQLLQDELIKHYGDKSINEKTDVKWPVKRINKKENKKQLNDQMGRLLYPRSPLMVFSELFKNIPIQINMHSYHNIKYYTAIIEKDGQMYSGKDVSKNQAKQKACENFLRLMLSKKLHKESEKKKNTEMEVGKNDSISKPKEPSQENFPWPQFASLAMYNFIHESKEQSVVTRANYAQEKSTVVKPQPKTGAMKKFPKNPENYNPVQLMYVMNPDVKFIETVINANFPTLFQVNCVIDEISFTGQAQKKKEAKKECCIAAIKYFWQFDFHAIENN